MISRYQFESLVPSWLALDPGYIAALGEHLAARMELQGYRITNGPYVTEQPSQAHIPVGTVLLTASVDVEEFDIDMADDAGGAGE